MVPCVALAQGADCPFECHEERRTNNPADGSRRHGEKFSYCRRNWTGLTGALRRPISTQSEARALSADQLYRPRFLGHRIEPYAALWTG